MGAQRVVHLEIRVRQVQEERRGVREQTREVDSGRVCRGETVGINLILLVLKLNI